MDEVLEPQQVPQRFNRSGAGGELVIFSGNVGRLRFVGSRMNSRLLVQSETYPRSGMLSKWVLFLLFSFVITILGALLCALTNPYYKDKKLCDVLYSKWWVMILVVVCGRLVCGWGIRVLVILIEGTVLLQKRTVYFVRSLREPVGDCVCSGVLMIASQFIFDQKVELDGNLWANVTKIWASLLVANIIWQSNTLLVKVIASCFHVRMFFERIQEFLHTQDVIKALSGPPLIQIHEDEKIDDGQKVQNTGATLLNQKKNISSIWNMKRLMNTLLDEKLEYKCEFRNENEAMLAANQIFCKVVKQGSEHIYLEDLIRFLGYDEASKTLKFFGCVSESEGISKEALKKWMVNVFREERALALSLTDTKDAFNGVHQVWNILVGVVIVVIWLFLFEVVTWHLVLFIFLELLWVVKVLDPSNFESIYFFFITHPFNVGDRCKVDNQEMIVEEMKLFITVFSTYRAKVMYPNSLLAKKTITYVPSKEPVITIRFILH